MRQTRHKQKVNTKKQNSATSQEQELFVWYFNLPVFLLTAWWTGSNRASRRWFLSQRSMFAQKRRLKLQLRLKVSLLLIQPQIIIIDLFNSEMVFHVVVVNVWFELLCLAELNWSIVFCWQLEKREYIFFLKQTFGHLITIDWLYFCDIWSWLKNSSKRKDCASVRDVIYFLKVAWTNLVDFQTNERLC